LASQPLSDKGIVSRCYDAAAINAVCNDPAVLPGLSLGLSRLDVSDLIADERNIAFMGEHGGALFHRSAPGVYAAHDFFLPAGRGKWALKASREMLARMFREFHARLIWAETPFANKACRLFNRWLGFRSEGFSVVALYPGAEPEQVETFVMEAPVCR
jgi:hypothetical protein